MANIKLIRSETDYDAALARIYELMDAEPGSPDGDELDVLVDLVELYERKPVRMGYPSPVAAIEFRMDHVQGITRRMANLFKHCNCARHHYRRRRRPDIPYARIGAAVPG